MTKKKSNVPADVRERIERQLSVTENLVAMAKFHNGEKKHTAVTVSCGVCMKNTKTGTYSEKIPSKLGSTTYKGPEDEDQDLEWLEKLDSSTPAIQALLKDVAGDLKEYAPGTMYAVEASAQITYEGEILGELILVAAYTDEQGNLAFECSNPTQR